MIDRFQGACPLPHLGVIRAQGEDAAKFLHGQLTQDFALLGLSQARLAAFCSAKGRMLASFVAFKRSHDELLLVCSRDLLPATLKRLSMFVLRAKARLSDASSEFMVWGLAGHAARTALPEATPLSWVKAEHGGGASVVALPPAWGQPRALWVAPAGHDAPAAAALDEALWALGEVHSGVATLSAPVVDAFVPQMLNYESVGGVNFKKGCYPGQEVVARSQFRGTLKRRAFIAHTDAAAQAGQALFHSADPSQPCGQVVQAAPAEGGGCDVIASLQLGATHEGTLWLGEPQAPGAAPLRLLPLPYPLLDDI